MAESCTGGLMSARLTELPGSSAYFAGGVVVYSNEAKVSLAGVDPELIARFGAVSNEVAEALASGAASRFDADVGVGITGIAGPDGGTEEKPVGTVCFSVCLRDGARITRRTLLPGSRADIRDRSTTVAMHLLRRLLLDAAGGAARRRRSRRAGVTGAGATARLFVALELPSAAREALVQWRSEVAGEVSGLRLVRPEDLHATLCFLGSRPVGEIEAISSACGVVAGEPVVDSAFGEGLWLPARRPRVLAVALSDPDGALGRIQSVLSGALAAGGWYAPESRPFLAHVTVARVGRDARVRRVELPRATGVRGALLARDAVPVAAWIGRRALRAAGVDRVGSSGEYRVSRARVPGRAGA